MLIGEYEKFLETRFQYYDKGRLPVRYQPKKFPRTYSDGCESLVNNRKLDEFLSTGNDLFNKSSYFIQYENFISRKMSSIKIRKNKAAFIQNVHVIMNINRIENK